MSVLCSNCGVSLKNNWILEAKAKDHGHSVYCKTCAKLYRRGETEKLKEREKKITVKCMEN